MQRLRNLIWSVAEVGLYPVALILATPVFIQSLGIEGYGHWLLLQTILFALGILNIGFGEALIKYISMYEAQSRNRYIPLAVNSALLIYTSIGLVCALMGLVVSSFGNYLTFPEAFWNSLPWIGMLFGLRQAEHIIISTLKGKGRYDLSGRLMIFSKSGGVILASVVAYWHANLTECVISLVFYAAIMTVIEWARAKSILGSLRLRWFFAKSVIRDMWHYSFWSWAQNASGIASTQTDKLIVAATGGASALTYYGLGSMVYNQVHTTLSASVSWLLPEISRRTAQKIQNHSAYLKSRDFVSFCAVLGLSLFLVFGDFAFDVWLGTDIYRDSRVYIFAFLAFGALMSNTIVPYFFLNGMGRIALNTKLEISLKTLNILSVFVGYQLFGTLGMIYGLIATTGVFVFVQEFVVQQRGLSSRVSLRGLQPMVASVLICGALLSSNQLVGWCLTVAALLLSMAGGLNLIISLIKNK